MVVVSNTSPINYLVLIEQINVLPILHERVIIPTAVSDELRAAGSPAPVRQWIEDPPNWLEILHPTLSPDQPLEYLGRGERDAILLAQQLRADLLVIDEGKAYREAQRRHIPVLRTLAVLDKAAERGLLDLPEAVARLRQTNFRIRPEILDQLLERHAARSKSQSHLARTPTQSDPL